MKTMLALSLGVLLGAAVPTAVSQTPPPPLPALPSGFQADPAAAEDGSGNSPGCVSLWVREEGALYRDKCRLEIGGAGSAAASGLSSTIAHELGHATKVRHHGETPPDYKTGDVRCKRPDGSFRNFLCSERAKDVYGKPVGLAEAAGNCYMVAAQGGSFSGNDQCLMRYDAADFYENASGNCQWKQGGKTVQGNQFPTEPPGMTVCWSGKGTGVNAGSQPERCRDHAS